MRSARRCARLIDQAADLTNAIIFCNRKRDVATLHRSLERHGYSVGALHGDMDQYARLKTLDSFRDGQIKLLVASDVAARGLDIPAVSHIFNFDVPTHSEDYVHRIGRTGRAGRRRPGADDRHPRRGEIHPVDREADRQGDRVVDGSRRNAACSATRPPRRRLRASARPGARAAAEPASGSRAAKNVPRAGSSARSAIGTREANAPRGGTIATIRLKRAGMGVQAAPPHAENLEDASRAVGFSDHVPDFLLRPVRLPREEPQVEEV